MSLEIRDLMYELAEIVVAAYAELNETNQLQFFPTGATFSGADTQLNASIGDSDGWLDNAESM